MIRVEHYKTRTDGVPLLKIWSDTDRLIRKNGVTYECTIDVSSSEYEELDELIAMDGPETYEEVLLLAEESSAVKRKINQIPLTDNEALSVRELYPSWEEKVGLTIEVGFIVLYDGNLWRARQTHTALGVYPPSVNTASLYEVIVQQHSGTMEDPIPYTPPMEIFEGKYYTQFDVLYKCTRNSGTALTHDLFDLRGIYVEMIEK